MRKLLTALGLFSLCALAVAADAAMASRTTVTGHARAAVGAPARAAIAALDDTALQKAIHASCTAKARVVASDEKESGVRALLNLGHTFGHAIEAGMGYGAWLHGEAVAAGMVLAAETSRLMGWLTEAEVARVVAVLAQAGLPTHSPDLGVDAWLGHMGHDKKVENGQLRFVLLEALGKAAVKSAVPVAVLQQVLQGTYIQQAKSPC